MRTVFWIGVAALVSAVGSQEPAEKPKPKAVGAPILEPFQRKCARCHGEFGRAFIAGYADKQTDEQLRDGTLAMIEGPGQMEMKDLEVDAMTAYSRSFSDQVPFAVWTAREGQVLSGEVTPETKIIAHSGDQEIPVKIKDQAWTLTLPAGTEPEKLVFDLTREEQKAVLNFSKFAWSIKPPKPENTRN